MVLTTIIMAAVVLAGCVSTDYTANMTGTSNYATVVVKDFVTLGIVTVRTTEIHHAGAFGFNRSIEGSKVTYADLMHEAARLEADDIINVRIDVNTSYKKGAFNWITGWTKEYTHIGTALAIKYTDRLDTRGIDSNLTEIPKAPEATGATRTTRSGNVILR